MALTLEPVVVEVLGKQSGEVLTLSALFAIWVASSAVEAFRIAFDRAYAVPDPRGFIENRALAIVLVFVGGRRRGAARRDDPLQPADPAVRASTCC